MFIRNYAAALTAALVFSTSLAAQQDAPSESTLPPVIVEPPQSAEPSPALSDEPVAPAFPSTNQPPFPPYDGSPYDGEAMSDAAPSLSYPDLSDLQFGEAGPFSEGTGILRTPMSLFDALVAGSILTRQEIEERQAPDMFHALQNEVGVLMQSTAAGQASPFVRGLTGQQVLILIDGVRLNNSIFRLGPNQYFNTIDPGMVDHIEVLRGQGSVLWGSDAIGGVINVVTRGPSIPGSEYLGNYGQREFTQYFNTSDSSSYSRLNVEGWAGQSGVFGGGSFHNVRDLDTGYDDFGRQPGTNYQQYSGDLKFNYLIDSSQLLTIAVQHHEQEDVARSDTFPGWPGDRNNSNTFGNVRFFDPQQRDLAYIRYQTTDPIAVFDAITFTASYHRQREVQTRGIPTTRYQEIDVESTGLNLVGVRDLGGLGKWTTGVDWYHDDVDSPFGGAATGPIIPDDAFYERIGWFLMWDLAITDRLTAVTGVRYEHINLAATPVVGNQAVFIDPHYQDWIGQIGLVYELDEDIHLVGSIAEGFRAPNLDELTANNPNVLQQGMDLPSLGLTPEHSITYEVGVKTNHEALRTQTFVFWTDLRDNIVAVPAGANLFERANQDSYIQGVETSGEYLFTDTWSLYGNFWYTYGRNEVTRAPLSRIPPTQGILGVRWRALDRRAYATLYTWMSRRQDRLDPVRDLSDERIPIGGTPGFATLNLRLGRTFGEYDQHRLSLSLENITDQPYLVHGSGVYGTGFTGRFGYSYVY